jgi:hypothetical protein
MRCELCGVETSENLCPHCWELRSRIEESPAVASRILAKVLLVRFVRRATSFFDSPAGAVALTVGTIFSILSLLALT